MLGLLAGAAAAFTRDRLDTRLRTAADVERLTGLPVIAELGVDSTGALVEPGARRRGARAGMPRGSLHELASVLLAARFGGRLLIRPVGTSRGLQELATVLSPAVAPTRILIGDDLHDLARADGALLRSSHRPLARGRRRQTWPGQERHPRHRRRRAPSRPARARRERDPSWRSPSRPSPANGVDTPLGRLVAPAGHRATGHDAHRGRDHRDDPAAAVAEVRPLGMGHVRGIRPVAWPIAALLLGYPVWWALGLGGLSVIVVAAPMAVILWRRRPLKVPPGFGLWLLLLAGLLLSSLMLAEMPPDTYGELGPGRFIGYLMRLALYLSLLVLVLYLGNLHEHELPQLTLIRMLGVLFITTIAGGLLGLVAPGFEFTSPVEMALPDWISGNSFVHNLIHPTAAQTQKMLGYAAPRPEAPFEWANAWGSNLSVLLIWFVVGWWVYGGARRRLVAVLIIAVAVVPIIYSLNRGLWIGLGSQRSTSWSAPAGAPGPRCAWWRRRGRWPSR